MAAAIGACALAVASPAAFAAAPQTSSSAASTERGGQNDSLAALGAQVGLRIGTAVNTDALSSDAAYRAITADQFSTVTPENVMKWDAVEPTQGAYNWGPADQLVAFAQSHRQLVRGHNLVWHNQLPAWLTEQAASMTPDQVRDILRKHITDEVAHFKGKIWQWDVVNEAFNDDGTLRDDIWLQKLGPSYIADAFRWAHAADPKAQLFYNDYNIEFTGQKSNAVYAFVQDLQKQGVPIDGVGFQTHLDTQYPLPDLQANLQRFADLGLNVAETEVDVRTTLPVTAVEQSAQNAGYSQSLQACLAVRECISYTVWGFGDAYSWVPNTFAGEGAADIYDENLQPKPQYFVLQQDLSLAAGAPQRSGRGSGRG
ncbi:MAG TPA: endo-1,4-beta-xylanase [Microbacteriaceae bacterium]|nr:endo-1,4-beta-xylanase [Microbacteriaceae bacterium]